MRAQQSNQLACTCSSELISLTTTPQLVISCKCMYMSARAINIEISCLCFQALSFLRSLRPHALCADFRALEVFGLDTRTHLLAQCRHALLNHDGGRDGGRFPFLAYTRALLCQVALLECLEANVVEPLALGVAIQRRAESNIGRPTKVAQPAELERLAGREVGVDAEVVQAQHSLYCHEDVLELEAHWLPENAPLVDHLAKQSLDCDPGERGKKN